jgi:tetratricopeptide (TPR) repeat protein
MEDNTEQNDAPKPQVGLLRRHRELVIILAISALLRALLLLEVAGGPCWRQYEWKDCDMNFFHKGAKEIASGDTLLDKPFHPYHNWHAMFGTREEWQKWYGGKRYYQDPGYYYLAAVFHAVFSDGPSAVKVFQLVLGLLTTLLVYAASYRMFGKRAAVISAVLLALCGPLYFYDVLLLRATVLTFATALFVFVAGEAFKRDSRGWWAGVGAVLGLSFLLKSTALLLVLATVGVLLWFGRRELKKSAVRAALLAAVFVAVLVPLFVRNAVVGAPVFSFSSVGSATFALGNGRNSSGDGLVVPDEMGEIMRRTDGAFWPVVRETYATHGSFLNVVGLWFSKAYYFFRNFETPNNASFYAYRQCSWVLSFLAVGFWLLTPLMAMGLYAAFTRRKAAARTWMLIGVILSLLAPAIFFFFVSRYRLPVAVPFAIFGGFGTAMLIEKFKARDYMASLILVSMAIPVGIFFNAWAPRFPGVRSSDYGARAIYYFNRRNFKAAAVELERGVEDYPNDPALNGYLALAYMALSRDEEAVEKMGLILERKPGDLVWRLRRANLLYEHRRYAGAAADLEVIVAARRDAQPGEELLARLAECYTRSGETSRARAILRDNPGVTQFLPPEVLRLIRK